MSHDLGEECFWLKEYQGPRPLGKNVPGVFEECKGAIGAGEK